MSQTIHYGGYASEEAKFAAALDDVKFYLGDRFDHCTNVIREAKSQREFEFAASFVGVQGFPVIAWYEYIHGAMSWKDDY